MDLVLTLSTLLVAAFGIGELRYRALRSGLTAAHPKRRSDASLAKPAPKRVQLFSCTECA